MSCHAEPDPLKDEGAISPYIVAGLSGLDPAQIERWRVEGVLPASQSNDEPDWEEFGEPPWFYSWNEHHRALGAAKLLELGLPPDELPTALARLDKACPRWAVTLVPKAIESALPEQIDCRRFFTERWHEGPLGTLYAFADVVEMMPGRCDSEPTIRGRRIRTSMLWLECLPTAGDKKLAADYWLTPYQVRRAVEFENTLRAVEQIHAPAAG